VTEGEPTTAAAARARIEPLVRHAGDHLLRSFEHLSDDDVHHKGSIDLVTRLDVEAQSILVEGVGRAFPEDGVIAEEALPAEVEAGRRIWYVDPLDGTTNFVHGQPVFAVSVAPRTGARVEIGCLRAVPDEFFWAAAGAGAWLGERRLRVSRRSPLGGALVATGFPYDLRTNPHNNLAEWASLARRCRGLRRLGAASLDLAYVAAGRFDGYWEFRLQPWDLAAGALLVLEAGGRVTDPAAGPRWLEGDLVATNGLVHDELVRALEAVRIERRRAAAPTREPRSPNGV
jgi:myo-inositol-1(or 4)-monophosphatase